MNHSVSHEPGADELRIRTLLIKQGVGPDAAQPAATARQRDWLDDILDTEQPEPAQDTKPASPPPAHDQRRIPPWWTGRHVDLNNDEDEPAEDDDAPETHEKPEDNAELLEPEDDPDDTQTSTDDETTQSKKRIPRLRIPTSQRPHRRTPTDSGAIIAAPAPRMSLLEAYSRIPVRTRWLGVHLTAGAIGYRLGWVQWSTRSSAWIDTHGWLNPSAGFFASLAIACELLRRKARHSILPVRIALAVPIASLAIGSLLYGTGWQHLNLELHP